MLQSLFYLLLLIFGSIQYARCGSEDVVDQFSQDFKIPGKDMVVHLTNRFSRRNFVFVAQNTSKDYCDVYVAHTDKSAYNLKTCKEWFRGTKGEKVTIERIYNYGDYISVTWYTAKMNADGMRRSLRVELHECSNGSRSPEKLEFEASAATPNQSEPGSASKELKSDNVTDVLKTMNFTWVSDLGEPVEIDSTRGLYFLAQSNGPDSKVDAMFMDLATKEVKDIGDVENLSVTKDQSRSSRAHNKYGQCYMDTINKMICSQQQLHNGQPWMVEFRQTKDFPDSIDWFSMTNLKEPAILLVTGKCPGKICNSYTITKMSKGERKDLLTINDVNASCENPTGVQHEINDHVGDGVFCFHFVCNNAETTGVVLHYRRHCVKRNIITSWG